MVVTTSRFFIEESVHGVNLYIRRLQDDLLGSYLVFTLIHLEVYRNHRGKPTRNISGTKQYEIIQIHVKSRYFM